MLVTGPTGPGKCTTLGAMIDVAMKNVAMIDWIYREMTLRGLARRAQWLARRATSKTERPTDKPTIARRPFQISAWGVKPRRQALSSVALTGSNPSGT
jgi:hypothetical protein